tara:strand:- start:250 stop:549 length:300 start_codon:yes stop_codon:yes gene_type:complete
MPVLEAVKHVVELQPVLCMWEEVADESQPLSAVLRSFRSGSARLAALIGPPGGFTEEEVTAIQEVGANLVTLGARVLRSETAAVAVISAILYELGDLGG